MRFLRRESPADPDPAEALRGAIRERVERAVAGDPQASGAAVDEVERLMHLLAAYERTRPPPRRRAWPVVALLLLCAVAVSLLLFLRVPSTEVTLALDLSSLTFRIGSDTGPGGAERVELLGRIHTDQVMIDDVDTVELDDIPIREPKASNFKLSTNGDAEFSIRPIDVPIGTWVRVKPPDEAGGLTIALAHPTDDLEIALSVPPEVEILPSDSALAERFDPALGEQRVVFRAERPAEGDDCARLRFRWLVPEPSSTSASADAADALSFRSTLPVDALLFTDLTSGSQHLSTRFSSVLGGVIYLEAVVGREVEIRRDQLLDVGMGTLAGYDPVRASGGPGFCADDGASKTPTAPARIMGIAVGADAVALQAGARVSRLSTGTATYRNDLMPRWLEWLQSRQELLLFWGAFGSLFGLAYTVLLWWRGTR
jgi:hypothetical protein